MEGSESPGDSSNSSRSGGRGGGSGHLGVNKLHSAKISKVVKRSVIQPPKQQAPVYTIDKNDFRNIVQKLTGSPAPPAEAPAAAPPPRPVATQPPALPPSNLPRNPNSHGFNTSTNANSNANANLNPNPNPPRLQRVKPPPLQSVFSFNKLVSNLAPVNSISLPQRHPPATAANFTGGVSRPTAAFQFPSSSGPNFFSPLPPLAPPGAAWGNASAGRSGLRPAAAPQMSFVSSSGPSLQPPPPPQAHYYSLQAMAAAPQHQQPSPSSFAQPPAPPPLHSSLLLPSSQQQQFASISPLPSPGSQFQLPPFSSSQVPCSPGSLFPLSPPAHFGFPGAGAGVGVLPPLSPTSLFPLSPAGQFPFSSF